MRSRGVRTDCAVHDDSRVVRGAGVGSATVVPPATGVRNAVRTPGAAVVLQLRLQHPDRRTVGVPLRDLRVRLIVTVAQHSLRFETIVHVVHDPGRVNSLELADHGLARRHRLAPALLVERAVGCELVDAIQRGVPIPRLSRRDVRRVGQWTELAVQPLDDHHVVHVVVWIVADPEDPVGAHVLLHHGPVDVLRGCFLEAGTGLCVVQQVDEGMHARVVAGFSVALIGDRVAPAVIGAEVPEPFPHVGAAAADEVRVCGAPVVLVALDERVRNGDAFPPDVRGEPGEAGAWCGVAPLPEDFERDRFPEDAAHLTVVEAEVLSTVDGQPFLELVHVDGEVRDGVAVPGGARGLADYRELDLSEAGRGVGFRINHHKIVGARVRAADRVEIAVVRPGVAPDLVHAGELFTRDGQPVPVAVGTEHVHCERIVVDRGVRRAGIEVFVVGGGARDRAFSDLVRVFGGGVSIVDVGGAAEECKEKHCDSPVVIAPSDSRLG